jgi:hypothetical protein
MLCPSLFIRLQSGMDVRGRVQNFQHIRNTIVCLGDSLNAIPQLTALGDEVVVRIGDGKCSRLFVELRVRYGPSPFG